MMKIYTSRYQNRDLVARPELLKVGITLGTPKMRLGYEVFRYVRLVAPTSAMFRIGEKSEFVPMYVARLNQIGVERVLEVLSEVSNSGGGLDLVLLCFEDVRFDENGQLNDWCHRLILAEWWHQQTGERILELEHIGMPFRVGIDLRTGEFEQVQIHQLRLW